MIYDLLLTYILNDLNYLMILVFHHKYHLHLNRYNKLNHKYKLYICYIKIIMLIHLFLN